MEKRRKGAQPGNTNALKHGLYCRHFSEVEEIDLQESSEGLGEEIRMLRALIRRVHKVTFTEDQDQETLCKLLNMISLSTYRLSRLMEIQQNLLVSDSTDIAVALSQALDEVTKKLFKGEAENR